VLQFLENLTDRQAAEAVRDRISWKYALGLEMDDPGFDPTVLSEFRARLVEGGLEALALEALLERLVEVGLLTDGGRARTDSTHVLGAIASLSRLELVEETVRAALEALAAQAPGWLVEVIDPAWQEAYASRAKSMRFPKSATKRQELMHAYAQDGYYLLDRLYSSGTPDLLLRLPAVQALRAIWVQQFYRQIHADGRQEIRRREKAPEGDGLPPGRERIISPYDVDARYGVKREKWWGGYTVTFTETCNPPTPEESSPEESSPEESSPEESGPVPVGPVGRAAPQRGERPNLITNVVTTVASVPDTELTAPIHQQLAAKNLLPQVHLVDSGFGSAEQILQAHRDHAITLITPMLQNNSAQAKAGNGYDKESFTIDFENRTATCPQGVANSFWAIGRQNTTEVITVGWKISDCRPCPARSLCTKSAKRTVTIRSRELHETLTQARAEQNTPEWKTRYAARAGIEGTIRQTTHVTGIRIARYRGLPKTQLEHILAATAINLIRLDHYWSGRRLDRTRTSHLARLDFTQTAA
jgi:IS5 family transposase